MLEFFEKIVNKAENIIEPEQRKFEIIQMAQIELIERAGGNEIAGTWIDVNSAAFRQFVEDPRFDYLNRLENDDTHEAAIIEIENKLTSLYTTH